MQLQAIQQISLSNFSSVAPVIQEFDKLRLDMIVPRPSIVAVADESYGLRFELPTPPGYGKMVEKITGHVGSSQYLPTLANGHIWLDYTEPVIRQIAALCRVNYGDLKREAEKFPDIAARRINAWMRDTDTINFNRKNVVEASGVRHLVRAFGPSQRLLNQNCQFGVLRAIKSDRFKLGLDASDILAVLLKLLQDKQDKFQKASLKVSVNDRYCHFTLDNHQLTYKSKVGDVCASMYGRTSDIGESSLVIEGRLLVLRCKNGWKTNRSYRRAHLGSKLEQLPDGMLSERTQRMQHATLLSEMYDAMSYIFNEGQFLETAQKIDRNTEQKVSTEEAKSVIQVVGSVMSISDETKDALFAQYLSEKTVDGEADNSQNGIVQAITAQGSSLAQLDYESALPFETVGGKIFNLQPVKFKELVAVCKNENEKAAKRILK